MKTELLTEQACINFIGKNTVLKFSFASEGILEYLSVTPKTINDEYYKISLELFYESDSDFFCYDEVKKLVFKKQIFELNITNIITGEKQNLYHKKYQNPKQDN
jgi:hypothetical protein